MLGSTVQWLLDTANDVFTNVCLVTAVGALLVKPDATAEGVNGLPLDWLERSCFGLGLTESCMSISGS
jgi:hypothetical protein